MWNSLIWLGKTGSLLGDQNYDVGQVCVEGTVGYWVLLSLLAFILKILHQTVQSWASFHNKSGYL